MDSNRRANSHFTLTLWNIILCIALISTFHIPLRSHRETESTRLSEREREGGRLCKRNNIEYYDYDTLAPAVAVVVATYCV